MQARAAGSRDQSSSRRSGTLDPARDLETPTVRSTGHAPPDFTRRAAPGASRARVEPVGAPRVASRCACGGGCPRCRNPQRATASDEPMTRAAATGAQRAASTRDGGGDADSTGGGAGGGAGGGGTTAPPARRARLKSGPRYTPNGSLTPTVAGDRKNVPFDFDAVFDSDPANGVFPGCGEVHQDIKWDAAAATSGNTIFHLTVPHGGFPATHPANVWIEDRDTADTRYGRRSGAHSAPSTGDQYTNAAGDQDEARGATYHGEDQPDVPAAMTGRWTFMVLAFDMCNQGTQIGSADFIVIDW